MFRGQNQRPSSWGRSPALLGRVGRASTNTGRFPVGGSRCGQRPARLRKPCYHSCYTDSVQDSKKVLMLCKFQAAFFFMWNEIFYVIGEKMLSTKAAPIASLNFDNSLVSEQTYVIGTNPHVPNRILCKTADLNRRPALGKDVCWDSNQTTQRLQMAARKSLETMSGVILNRSQPNFADTSVANEMWCLKAM